MYLFTHRQRQQKGKKKKTFWKWLNVSAFNTNFFFCYFSFTNILLNLYVLPFSIKCELIAFHYLFIFFRRFNYSVHTNKVVFIFFLLFFVKLFGKVFMYITFYTLFLNFFIVIHSFDLIDLFTLCSFKLIVFYPCFRCFFNNSMKC